MDSQLASFGSEPIRHFWGPKTVKLAPVGTDAGSSSGPSQSTPHVEP